jgi:hypothetical protein
MKRVGTSAAAAEAAEANAAIARLVQGEFERLFRASAEAFVKAWERGARDVEVAENCRHIFESEGFSSPEADELYTSPAAVGNHRRTGLILRKKGELPPGVKARDVQTLVRKLRVGQVDDVIANCPTQGDAYRALQELTERPHGPKGRNRK